MMIQGTAVAAAALHEPEGQVRFWYWHGASGRRYIHSIYPAGSCPPLPGAVYVAVKRMAEMRMAVAIGRFPVIWDMRAAAAAGHGADELHVHLLARDEAEADVILADLTDAFAPSGSMQGRRQFLERDVANAQFAEMFERREHVVAAGA